MKINDNKEIFMEVRFEDLKTGDTFAIKDETGYTYAMKTSTRIVTEFAVDLENGLAIWPNPSDLVIPVEITGDVKWPIGVFKRK